MSQAPLLSIIVVSYNTREETLACLESVFETAGTLDFELILWDNASTDGSAAAIAEAWGQDPRLRLIASPDNLGFGGANNAASAEMRGQYLLLLNPDTVVHPGAIQTLLAFATARPEAKVWGGRTWFADGSLNATSCFRQMSLWSLLCMATGMTILFPRSEILNPEPYGGWPRDTEREVEVVTGCFFLIESAFWRRLGGFDPRFFMFAEEADLCLRAVRAGARPRVTPEANIIHHGGASMAVRADRLKRLFTGKATLIDKHWRAPARPLGLALLALVVFNRQIGYRLAGWLLGRPRLRETGAAWRTLWRDRAVWLGGYPEPG